MHVRHDGPGPDDIVYQLPDHVDPKRQKPLEVCGKVVIHARHPSTITNTSTSLTSKVLEVQGLVVDIAVPITRPDLGLVHQYPYYTKMSLEAGVMPPSPSSSPPTTVNRRSRPGPSSLAAADTAYAARDSGAPSRGASGVAPVQRQQIDSAMVDAGTMTPAGASSDADLSDVEDGGGMSGVVTGSATDATDTTSDSDDDSDDDDDRKTGAGAGNDDIGLLLDPTARAPGRASARDQSTAEDHERRRRRKQQRKLRRQRRDSKLAAGAVPVVHEGAAQGVGGTQADEQEGAGLTTAQRNQVDRERRRLVHQDFDCGTNSTGMCEVVY